MLHKFTWVLLLALTLSTTAQCDTLCIAHRGLAKNGIHGNSLRSISRSFEVGADMVEVDVNMTSDEVLVLFHDRRSKGKAVKELSFERLQKNHRSKGLTTLEQALKSIPENKTILLDLKAQSSRFIQRLAEGLESTNLTKDQIIIQSKDYDTLSALQKHLPHYEYFLVLNPFRSPYGFPIGEPDRIAQHLKDYNIDGLSLKNADYIDIEFQQAFDKLNLTLFVWTANKRSDLEQLLELNVSGIITDNPKRLIKLNNQR